MPEPHLQSAAALVPAGAWAVGVSGGADSVALLSLLRCRSDLSLHVVHLDHQTRGDESTGDARYVAELSRRWGLPCTIATRDQIEPTLPDPPANTSAKYRACRLALYRNVVHEQRLEGVILAHHADDQAETILQRLIRGSSYVGLAGMSVRTVVGGLEIVRPLLELRRAELREYLAAESVSWREDASNESDAYLRNRLRKVLSESRELFDSLLRLGPACSALRDWSRDHAPELPERFGVNQLTGLPRILADESIRRWLLARGIAPDHLDPAAIERVWQMASDAASPAQFDFPGNLAVRRRQGMIFTETR